MIRDAHHPLLTALWHRYVGYRLRTAFRGVWVQGALPSGDAPVLLYANHCSFWDGFVVANLVRRAGREGYAVMEEQNLARHRFLTRLGALSIRRGDPRSAVETLRHCARRLQRPRASLLLFPQGRIEAHRAPLRFEGGLQVLARLAAVRAVPIALRYAFFEHEYPDVLVSVGDAHEVGALADAEARLEHLRDGLHRVDAPAALPLAVAGRRSVAERAPRFSLKEVS